MGRIRVLDDVTASKIAAGEVVDRPASVVKELVENALDAGASKIEVEIAGGGMTSIKVTDNGCGMDRDDALLALERHATSKIARAADIDAVTTLGFRGEALPSIASVSKMSLRTKARGAAAGHLVNAEGGQVTGVQVTGCAEGTSITVRDLFYNTPARRKFIRSVSYEAGLCTEVVGRLALSRPDVAFVVRQNGRLSLQTPGTGKLFDAITAVMGLSVSREMLEVVWEGEWFSIEGWIGKPGLTRNSRRHQVLYVNGRYVKNYYLSGAYDEAYRDLVPSGRYPVGVLHLKIDRKRIDVNVHPSKMEVRLDGGRELNYKVAQIMRRALRDRKIVAEVKWSDAAPMSVSGKSASIPAHNQSYDRTAPPVQAGMQWQEEAGCYDRQLRLEPLAHLAPTYILALGADGLYIIDQHAAHERVLFEEYERKLKDGHTRTQVLLQPLVLNLDPGQEGILREYWQWLSGAGFLIEEFGGSDLLLRAVPAGTPAGEEEELITDLLERLHKDRPVNETGFQHALVASLACRAAVKGGQKLDPAEQRVLLQRLAAADNPYSCPHGRPTLVKISFDELAKKFLRE
ncbi:MAG: DNA mismatch repair endonuclease MutL [Peptococcaceae bacterium]|nr:DNA mismatch repair endonuclease MutL [Peptococcaceae bacterium]